MNNIEQKRKTAATISIINMTLSSFFCFFVIYFLFFGKGDRSFFKTIKAGLMISKEEFILGSGHSINLFLFPLLYGLLNVLFVTGYFAWKKNKPIKIITYSSATLGAIFSVSGVILFDGIPLVAAATVLVGFGAVALMLAERRM